MPGPLKSAERGVETSCMRGVDSLVLGLGSTDTPRPGTSDSRGCVCACSGGRSGAWLWALLAISSSAHTFSGPGRP